MILLYCRFYYRVKDIALPKTFEFCRAWFCEFQNKLPVRLSFAGQQLNCPIYQRHPSALPDLAKTSDVSELRSGVFARMLAHSTVIFANSTFERQTSRSIFSFYYRKFYCKVLIMPRKSPVESVDLDISIHPVRTVHQIVSLHCKVLWSPNDFETFAGRIKFRLSEPLRLGMEDCSDCCEIIQPICLHEDYMDLTLHPVNLTFSSLSLKKRVGVSRCDVFNCRRLFIIFTSIEPAEQQFRTSAGPPKHFIVKLPRPIYRSDEDNNVKLKWDFRV